MADSLRKEITRRYKKGLSKERLKKFRSKMWLFRRGWKYLSAESQAKLARLFDEVPALGEVYHRREKLSEIFDTAENAAQDQVQIDA